MKDLLAIEFLYPWVLLGLLALPALAWFQRRPRTVPSLAIPSLAGLGHLGRIPARQRAATHALWTLIPLALLIVGLAATLVLRARTQGKVAPADGKEVDQEAGQHKATLPKAAVNPDPDSNPIRRAEF